MSDFHLWTVVSRRQGKTCSAVLPSRSLVETLHEIQDFIASDAVPGMVKALEKQRADFLSELIYGDTGPQRPLEPYFVRLAQEALDQGWKSYSSIPVRDEACEAILKAKMELRRDELRSAFSKNPSMVFSASGFSSYFYQLAQAEYEAHQRMKIDWPEDVEK